MKRMACGDSYGLESIGERLAGEKKWEKIYTDSLRASPRNVQLKNEKSEEEDEENEERKSSQGSSTVSYEGNHDNEESEPNGPLDPMETEMREEDGTANAEEKPDMMKNFMSALQYWYYMNRALGAPMAESSNLISEDCEPTFSVEGTENDGNTPRWPSAQNLNSLFLLQSIKQQLQSQAAGNAQLDMSQMAQLMSMNPAFLQSAFLNYAGGQDPSSNLCSAPANYTDSNGSVDAFKPNGSHIPFQNFDQDFSEDEPLDLTRKSSMEANHGILSDDQDAFTSAEHSAARLASKVSNRAVKAYTNEELEAALHDIQSGKLGTRRAAVIYGIPRSTLRNKVYKRSKEKMNHLQGKLPSSMPLEPTGHPVTYESYCCLENDKKEDNTEERKPDEVIDQKDFKETLARMPFDARNGVCSYEYDMDERRESNLGKAQSSFSKEEKYGSGEENVEGKDGLEENDVSDEKRMLKKWLATKILKKEDSSVGITAAVDMNNYDGTTQSAEFESFSSSGTEFVKNPEVSDASDNNQSEPDSLVENSAIHDDKNSFNLSRDVILKIPAVLHNKSSPNPSISKNHLKRSSPCPGSKEEDNEQPAPKRFSTVIGNDVSERSSPTGSAMNGDYDGIHNMVPKQVNLHHNNRNERPVSNSNSCQTSNESGNDTKKSRPKRGKYRNYDRDALLKAVRAVQNGEMSVHRAGSHFGVPHSTLEYKVKERHLLRRPKRKNALESNASPAVGSKIRSTSPESSLRTRVSSVSSSSEQDASNLQYGSAYQNLPGSAAADIRQTLSRYLSLGHVMNLFGSSNNCTNPNEILAQMNGTDEGPSSSSGLSNHRNSDLLNFNLSCLTGGAERLPYNATTNSPLNAAVAAAALASTGLSTSPLMNFLTLDEIIQQNSFPAQNQSLLDLSKKF